jgi:hypothetical protein
MYITLLTTAANAAVGSSCHYVKLSTRLPVLQSTALSLTFAGRVHTNILVANYTQFAVGFLRDIHCKTFIAKCVCYISALEL